MDVESLRTFCKTLPAVTEEIKWANDLCFSVGGKMFCVVGLKSPHRFSFKVADEDFDELSSSEGFIPAPYMARAKWVSTETPHRIKKNEGQQFVRISNDLVKAKLTKKIRVELGLD